jgi:UDP-N-acetylmuramoylalanine--D-glutamate ligase
MKGAPERPRPTAASPHAWLAERPVVVMGLGSFGGGAGAARYLAGLGARVVATDLRPASGLPEALAELSGLPVELVLEEHRPADFQRAELVVVNPAVRPGHELVDLARRAGARISSEIELFLEAVRARVVAITGTQGKSSTANALHALLSLCGERAHLGGNIGGSLLARLPEIGPQDTVVLELSSYQLEALAGNRDAARAEAVAIVNVLVDHLERHGSVEGYLAAKLRILELLRPGGCAVLPADDPRLAGAQVPGRKLLFGTGGTGRDLHLREGGFWLDGERLASVADLALPGDFQRANALVALGLARILGLGAERLTRALPRVQGLEHRLQELGHYRGRRVIDNAVSTTPDSTISALRALSAPLVLVLGGRLKRLPLDGLVHCCRERVGHAVAFGEAGPPLAEALERAGVPVTVSGGVQEAVQRALELAPPGGTLLFSPACSSFDAYANFRQRALAFRSALGARDERP